MCQAISKGGKRCLVHQAGTVAVIRYVGRKLNISDSQVHESVKELNKEDRNLPAPSQEEVEGFIALEEFKTKLDPDLAERDRKIILKNYGKARVQAAEQGVTGGAFHAWKNTFTRAYAKFKRSAMAIGAAGLIAVSLSACGGLQASPSQQPGEVPAPTAPSVSQPATPSAELEDIYPNDATVPLAEVQDEFGSYTHVTVDPNSELATYKPETVVGDLGAFGFSDQDAQRAHELATNFYVEQTMDSTAYDNSNITADAWYQEVGGKTLSSDWYSAENFQGSDFGNLVANSAVPDPIEGRAGGQRSEITGSVHAIFPTQAADGSNVLLVGVVGNARTPMSDAAVQRWFESSGGDLSQLEQSLPQYFDGKDEGGLSVNMSVTYTFNATDLQNGLISGHNADREVAPW